MPKLHTPTHDIPALEQRLKDLLEKPPERLAVFAPQPSRLQRAVRRWAAGGPIRRKIISAFKGWRLASYSPRWLAVKILRKWSLARRVHARLYFPRQVISELQRLNELVRQSNERQSSEQKHLEVLLRESNERALKQFDEYQKQFDEHQKHVDAHQKQIDEQRTLFNDLMGKVGLLEHILTTTQNRLGHLETGDQNPAAAQDYSDYYLALENIYRGESSAIEARFEPYLAFIRDAAAGSPSHPVLDLGCGRGEWLSILRREGLNALGIDADADMLEQARNRGECVAQGDLLAFIENAAPGSYGAVTAFQVVEHLPLDILMRLFAAAARALKPGGTIILETPNPENLQVSGYSFWLDPTHVRPLPPPLLDYFARYFGFTDVRIVRTNPWPVDLHFTEDTPAARHLNKLLFCEQDYALVARKPL